METKRQNPPMTVADPGTRTGRLDLMRGLPVVIAFVIQSGLYVFNGIDDSMDLIDASWIFMFAVTVAMLVAAAFRCRKFPAMLWKSALLYFAVGAMFVLEFEARFIPEAWHPRTLDMPFTCSSHAFRLSFRAWPEDLIFHRDILARRHGWHRGNACPDSRDSHACHPGKS